jgi:antirestriction protein ArdC
MAVDLYQAVTDRIIESLESGVAPWVRPWTCTGKHGGMPYNAASGKPYRGINVALLWAPQYATAAWLTFKQAKDLGAHVRKGERGSMIVFYKPFAVTDRNAAPDANGNRPERLIPLLRSFTVFNVAQIDDLPERFAAPVVAETPAESVRDAMMAIADVRHGGDRAFYAPGPDYIQLPHAAQFATIGEYRATALHELTHWTGHASRCAREYGKRFGDSAYAREELVAEMGAAFLCAIAGVDGRLQHAEYISHWLAVLKADKRAIVTAASHAQKAADYVLAQSGANVVDEEQEAA